LEALYASRWSALDCYHIIRKESQLRIPSLPASGSFFDEKMLDLYTLTRHG